jgi:hypothetical protein
MRRRILHFTSLLQYSSESPTKMLTDLSLLEADLKLVIADLPPELTYVEENLFVHGEGRTAFVLLHMLRHNCFLLLAKARLSVCGRDSRFAEASHHFLRDRLKHAMPISAIVADVLRLGTNCDPFVAVQAYMAMEGAFSITHMSLT